MGLWWRVSVVLEALRHELVTALAGVLLTSPCHVVVVLVMAFHQALRVGWVASWS